MKTKCICVVVLFLIMFSNVCSQEIYQQTHIEMNDVLDDDESYFCQATTSIKLLPGFKYKPNKNNNLNLEIDRYSVFPPDEGFYGGAMNDGVVGSLPACFSMSNTGAAVYSIDLKLPNAIGSMMPKLSFVYNSQSANGLLGWAWSLSGLSSVERVGQTKYHDGSVTYVNFKDDRYVIDGLRLMLVKGMYGSNNAEYKTEVDNFDKIVSYAKNNKGPESFVVWKSDGTIWEYGTTNDSRIETHHDNDVVLKWLLCKISDRNGNSIVFNYDKCAEEGEAYINNIAYTINERAGVGPAYTIRFVYDDKGADMSMAYVYGNVVTSKRILKNVLVINNYTGRQLYDYSLEYHKPGLYGRNYFIHYRLKSVGLSIGDDKINPTQIIWNSEKHYPSYVDNFQIYQQDRSVFSNVPFVGDFNGDGLSDVLVVPYKIQNTYPDNIVGNVYLNKGNGTFENKPAMSVTLSKNLEWIYVVDLNGDAVDDIVTYEMNYDTETQDDYLSQIGFYIVGDGKIEICESFLYKNNVVVIPGRFVRNDRSDVLVLDAYDENGKGKKKFSCFYYKDGLICKNDVDGSNDLNGADADFLALDVTGDGYTELLMLKKDGYDIYDINDRFAVGLMASGTSLSNDKYMFPNDFNGDGKTDVLYYDSSRCWEMAFSDGKDFTVSSSCSAAGLLRSIVLNHKDRYRYSLRELERPSVTIRTADFDGDGTADVGVFKNMAGTYYLEVGLHPYIKSNGMVEFACENKYFMPINYSHQTIQLGRFLPQENVSVLSALPRNPLNSQKAYISSLYPHTSFYSVERIVDGMGNIRGFSYGYLMSRKQDGDESFYSCDNVTEGDIKRISIPVAALKSDTTFNVNDNSVVNKYQYNNALIHSDGHGFIGFERVVVRNYVNGKLVQKQVQENECKSMSDYSMCLPFLKQIFQGEKHLIKENVYLYSKYYCSKNKKVVAPFVNLSYETDYSFDKLNDVLRIVITENYYESDAYSNEFYNDYVHYKGGSKGVTDNVSISFPHDCSYVTESYVEHNDVVADWIINRPSRIYNYSYGKTGELFGSTQMLVYDDNCPTRVLKETKIPNVNEDYSDPLSVVVSYDYDKVGNVISRVMSSPSDEREKIVRYEYGDKSQYRYKTKTIDELGREIYCEYDADYGSLTSTKDYNGFVTVSQEHPTGVTSMVELPDGMQRIVAFRWAKGNEYAPQSASYYMWEKSTGNAESMTFYHKSGKELRNVTFDVNGNVVFADVLYDDFGNVRQKSVPYYKGDEKFYVTSVYDQFNRPVEIIYPNALMKRLRYNGNSVVSEIISKDGRRHCETHKYNEANWLVETMDAGGNKIEYEYCCDGLVKSAQVGNDSKTKISLTYDNLRNRTSLNDPNYGLTSYEYDVWGNIVKIKSPKSEVELRYDMSGRMISKIERDMHGKDVNSISWHYDMERGRNGLLKRVVSSNNHQIDYVYDDKLRLHESKERINGNCYSTSYTYDEANRVSTITYPSGLCVGKVYSNSGYEKEVVDVSDNMVLWRTNGTNAYGCITDFQYGNGIKTEMSYDAKTSLVDGIASVNGNDLVQELSYLYDGFGNVVSRKKTDGRQMEENFEYDDLDRLVGVRLNGSETVKMIYDNHGNISEKYVNGMGAFYAATFDADRPNAILKFKTEDEKAFSDFGKSMTYSLSDDLVYVSNGDDFAKIEYGCDDARIMMTTKVDGVLKKKTYVGDCEIVEENGGRCFNTFIHGPNGIFAVCVIDGDGVKSYNYIHKDNLGSWNVITDENAVIVQKLCFDAWGNVRSYEDWNIENAESELLFDRGFTGHEHLQDFGLINMNGRFYDPLMSLMLSPDNNIQKPQLSQNFNRYSYCLNNPLKYYDPSGESVEGVVFGVVGGAVNVLVNARSIDTFGEFALLFGVGFVKGFLTEYTMGQSWFVQVGVQTLMGGLTSGVNQMVEVGDGSFKLSGDDWNSVKTAAHYGLGSGLVKGFMNSYFTSPSDEYFGDKMMDAFYNEELGHAFTSIAAHGMGCWFSGKPFLQTLEFKDVGFDLKMLGCIASRLLASYIEECGFAENVIERRTSEIKETVLNDIRSEDPDFPDFECTYELNPVRMSDGRVYIVGDVFALLPGEMLNIYPKPYFQEVVSFPFSYSLFKTLFFHNK